MLAIYNNLNVTENVSLFAALLAGFTSFFSACVFPIIPLYMSYLAGEGELQPDGSMRYDRRKTLLRTVLFVLGISTVFFILGLGAYGLGSLISATLSQYQSMILKIVGIVIILFGLVQLGVFHMNFLNHTKSFQNRLNPKGMTYFKAYLMGFLFSFAWSPCTGITLGAILALAAGSGTAGYGNFLILMYTIGFITPFLILGFFTTSILNVFKDRGKVVQWAGRIGGILLIFIGILTFTGNLTRLTVWMAS